MMLPGGKVASGLPPVPGGEPTPVKRVSSSPAPRPAANRVLSSLVPRSSLISAIQVPQLASARQWLRHWPIRELPIGQCKDRPPLRRRGTAEVAGSTLHESQHAVTTDQPVLIAFAGNALQLAAQFVEIFLGVIASFLYWPKLIEQRHRC